MQARMSGCLRFLNHLVLWGGVRGRPQATAPSLPSWECVSKSFTGSLSLTSLVQSPKSSLLFTLCLPGLFLWLPLPSTEDWPLHSPSPVPSWCFLSTSHQDTLHRDTLTIVCTYPATLCIEWLSLICSKSLIIKHRQIYFLSDWKPKYLQTSSVPFEWVLFTYKQGSRFS